MQFEFVFFRAHTVNFGFRTPRQPTSQDPRSGEVSETDFDKTTELLVDYLTDHSSLQKGSPEGPFPPLTAALMITPLPQAALAVVLRCALRSDLMHSSAHTLPGSAVLNGYSTVFDPR